MLVLNLVLAKSGILLHEIQKELCNLFNVEVATSTTCKFLQKSNFTRQKLCYVALQRDEFLRQKFILDVSVYSLDIF